MPRAALSGGRKLFLLLFLAFAILGGAWWWQRPPPDPVDGGQRLSEFVCKPEFLRSSYIGADVAKERLRHFGPAGVAWLAYQLEHGRHPFVRQGALPFDHAPPWLIRWVPERWGGLRAASDLDVRHNAALALSLLGPEAAPAIPVLARSLQRSEDAVAGGIAIALHKTGRAAWPTVHEILAQGSAPARIALCTTILGRVLDEEPEPDAEAARLLADLVRACHDPDAQVRASASFAIGVYAHYRPDAVLFDTAVSVLIRGLSDADSRVRESAASSIAQFEARGAPATARLIELLEDSSPKARLLAAYALGKVDGLDKRSVARLRTMLLHDSDANCRQAAGNALRAFGLLPDEAGTSAAALPAQ